MKIFIFVLLGLIAALNANHDAYKRSLEDEEQACPERTCTSGKCYTYQQSGDGICNCLDGSDEPAGYCTPGSTCPQRTCKNTHYICYNSTQINNGICTCPEGDDEPLTNACSKAPVAPPTTTKAPTAPPTTTKAPTAPPTTTKAPTAPPTTTKAPTAPPTSDCVSTIIYAGGFKNDFTGDYSWGVYNLSAQLNGKSVLSLQLSNYNGLQLRCGTGNCITTPKYTKVSLSVFSAVAGVKFRLRLRTNDAEVGNQILLTVAAANTWETFTVALSTLSNGNAFNVVQIQDDGGSGSTLYVDNVKVENDKCTSPPPTKAPTVPPTAPTKAPTPAPTTADCVSLVVFSNGFKNNFSGDYSWGVYNLAAQLNGKTVLSLQLENYSGLQLRCGAGNCISATTYSKVTLSVYSSAVGAKFRLRLRINDAEVGNQIISTIAAANTWQTVTVALSSLSNGTAFNVFQIQDDGGNGATLFVDNVIFQNNKC